MCQKLNLGSIKKSIWYELNEFHYYSYAYQSKKHKITFQERFHPGKNDGQNPFFDNFLGRRRFHFRRARQHHWSDVLQAEQVWIVK